MKKLQVILAVAAAMFCVGTIFYAAHANVVPCRWPNVCAN